MKTLPEQWWHKSEGRVLFRSRHNPFEIVYASCPPYSAKVRLRGHLVDKQVPRAFFEKHYIRHLKPEIKMEPISAIIVYGKNRTEIIAKSDEGKVLQEFESVRGETYLHFSDGDVVHAKWDKNAEAWFFKHISGSSECDVLNECEYSSVSQTLIIEAWGSTILSLEVSSGPSDLDIDCFIQSLAEDSFSKETWKQLMFERDKRAQENT